MPTVTVGAALSQSGMYALQGLQALQGITLWVEETNRAGGLFVSQLGGSVPLWLRTYDAHSRRADGEHLVAQLITQERVDLLIGPYSSGLTLAAAAVAEDHRKLLWNHGGSSDAIMQRGFRWAGRVPMRRYWRRHVGWTVARFTAAFSWSLKRVPKSGTRRCSCSGSAPRSGGRHRCHAPI